MKKMIMTMVMLAVPGIISIARADIIVSYGFNNTLSPSETDPNVTTSNFGVGSGISAPGFSSTLKTEGSHSVNWNKAGWNSTTEASSISANRYVTFTVNVNSGYRAYINELSFYVLRRAGTVYTDGVGAPDSFALYTSLDGFSSPVGSGPVPGNLSDDNVFTEVTVDLSGVPALQSVENGIEFRIYMWASQGVGATDERRFFIDDFILRGNVGVDLFASYGFNNSLVSSDLEPYSTAGNFGTGSGISAPGFSSTLKTEGSHSVTWNKAGWNSATEASAKNANRYLAFTLNIVPGLYGAHINELNFFVLRRAGIIHTDGMGAPDSFAIYTSLDGFSSSVAYGSVPGNVNDDNVFSKVTVDLSGVPALQPVGSSIEFRIYMWASQGVGSPDERRFFIDDLKLKGRAPSVYFVAVNGSDGNAGTSIEAPFRTIKAAADIMIAGDICYIREGVYREMIRPANTGSESNMITFMPYNGETVTVSAADEITGWTVYSNHIYIADMSWSLGEGFDQVFVNGVMVNRARWPNSGTDLLNPTQASGTATADAISFSVSRPTNYWVGGTVYGQFGDKWTSQGGTITQSTSGGVLSVADKTSPWFTGSGEGYITGVFGELDSPGEWFLKDGKLYLWAPNSVDPSSITVEAKVRKWVINLTGTSYIRIKDLNLFGGSLRLICDGSEINGVKAKYLSHFTKYTWSGYDASGGAANGNNGIEIRGSENAILYSTFEFSAGSGILLDGGGSNIVARNIIREMNYSGTYSCPLAVTRKSAGGNLIVFNTMYNTGRDIVQLYGARNDKVMYNELYNAGKLCHDLGIIYHFGQDGKGTRIAYNWVYNNLAPYANPGIYHDNYCRDFITDHNVIWNCEAGVRLNAPTDAMHVYNNTVFNCDDVGSNTFNAWPVNIPQYWLDAGYGDINNRMLVNNLFLGTSPSAQLVNYAGKDFRLKAGAAAIDAGVEISPYTDGYLGQAPDKGAYEYGGVHWTAGHAGLGPLE